MMHTRSIIVHYFSVNKNVFRVSRSQLVCYDNFISSVYNLHTVDIDTHLRSGVIVANVKVRPCSSNNYQPAFNNVH